MEFALALAVLGLIVALAVLRPLRGDDEGERTEGDRPTLEAAKEAKYREIRDAELDFQMGKLSESDYRRTDGELRAEAIEILRRLDELGDREG